MKRDDQEQLEKSVRKRGITATEKNWNEEAIEIALSVYARSLTRSRQSTHLQIASTQEARLPRCLMTAFC